MKKFLKKVWEIVKFAAEKIKWFFDTLSVEDGFGKIGWAIAFALLLVIILIVL